MRKGSHFTPEQHKRLCDSVKGKTRPPRTEATRKKLSESTKRTMAIPENRERIRQALIGHPVSEETRKKIGEKSKGNTHKRGKSLSETSRKKIGEVQKGRKASEETKKKMSLAAKGKIRSPEHRRKMSEVTTGEKNHFWKGGISFAPYCQKFNNEFKERVRAFFGYQCAECGAPQNGAKLQVHHVNFNKQSCCDSSMPLFVPLCPSCHSRTNHNRFFWEHWFTEMIMRHYGGQCYFPRELPASQMALPARAGA